MFSDRIRLCVPDTNYDDCVRLSDNVRWFNWNSRKGKNIKLKNSFW